MQCAFYKEKMFTGTFDANFVGYILMQPAPFSWSHNSRDSWSLSHLHHDLFSSFSFGKRILQTSEILNFVCDVWEGDQLSTRGKWHPVSLRMFEYNFKYFEECLKAIWVWRKCFLHIFTFDDPAFCDLQFCLACISIFVGLIFSSVFVCLSG